MKQATFAAGCFWHVEEAFRTISGVLSTRVGYMGGKTVSPTYAEVCTDKTGHAEAVNMMYDPAKISYEYLLNIFWKIHNPTQKNCQGVDEGSQYRGIIFYHDDEQKKIAELSKKEEQKKYSKPIMTEIVPSTIFYRAEEYHQHYFMQRGEKICGI